MIFRLSSLFDDDGLNDILNFCEARPDLDTLRGEEEGEGEENVAQNESDSDNSDQEVSDQGLATLRIFLLFFSVKVVELAGRANRRRLAFL